MSGFTSNDEIYFKDLMFEELGKQMVLSAIHNLVAQLDQNRFVWGWGDGYGGYVRSVLDAQLQSIGLPLRPQTSPKHDVKRKEILERDGYICVNCGNEDDLHIDHIHPKSRGGSDEPDNLQVLCSACNYSKRAMTMEEWEASGRAQARREHS